MLRRTPFLLMMMVVVVLTVASVGDGAGTGTATRAIEAHLLERQAPTNASSAEAYPSVEQQVAPTASESTPPAPVSPSRPAAAAASGFSAAVSVAARLRGVDRVAALAEPAVGRLHDDACRAEARLFLDALAQRQPWAVTMVDASAPGLPAGTLAGTSAALGDFDECLALGSVQPAPLRPRYCLARLHLPHRDASAVLPPSYDMNSGISRDDILMGVCVPASCDSKDVQEFLSDVLSTGVNVSTEEVRVQVDDDMCQIQESLKVDWLDAIFIITISFLFIVIIVSSAFDIIKSTQNDQEKDVRSTSILMKILLSFSAPYNFKRLFKYESSGEGFDCLFGIKAIAMILIVNSHTGVFLLGGPVSNGDYTHYFVLQPLNFILDSNILYVETFLFVGAFLLGHHTIKNVSKNLPVNPLKGFILRYIRLTPAYALVLLAHATLFEWTGSGPLWMAQIGRERQHCRAVGWTNFLYINNYVATDTICMFQSWYLAVDTQLFAVSVVLLWVVGRRPRLRAFLLLSLVGASAVVCFADALTRTFDPILVVRLKDLEEVTLAESYVNSYIKTHLRATSYFCGLLLSHLLFEFQASDRKIPKWAAQLGWVVAIFAGLASIFSVGIFYWPFHPVSRLESAFYSGCVRLAWSVFMGWIIFACATDNAGSARRVLSWRVLVPLGRLSYCAYLINGLIERRNIGSQRTLINEDFYSMAKANLSDVVITYVGAILLTLLIDSPMQALQSVLITKERRKSKEEIADDTTKT